ncbi:MAG: HD domain-containing protein [Oscillibacter sp.]
MKISLNDVLFAFSNGLDCVEAELLGATANHGKRVAYLCAVLGKYLGMSEETRFDLAACAVLHDNALTEYLRGECNRTQFAEADPVEMALHCQIGEKNAQRLDFHSDVSGAILYHHEHADGSGTFGKTASETPLMAQLIHLADALDVACNLGSYNKGTAQEVQAFLEANRATLFAPELVTLFLEHFPAEKLQQMQGDRIDALVRAELPECAREYSKQALLNIAQMFATIIDYKSEVTGTHSLGIAEKALTMAAYYGFDDETTQKLYLAAAVHDVGKLVVSRELLEKPEKLNAAEYQRIQAHAWHSYSILKQIHGFEDITNWAALHHEKLNGTGYPFGKTASELGQKERLMACLDVYQALMEKRSYKDSMSHGEAMAILRDMAQGGELDPGIVADLDRVFGGTETA